MFVLVLKVEAHQANMDGRVTSANGMQYDSRRLATSCVTAGSCLREMMLWLDTGLAITHFGL